MTASTSVLQFGIPGGPELLIIVLIAVLLFGANKIPKLARSTGEAMGEFKKGREEVEKELQEMRGSVSGESEPDTGSETEVVSESTDVTDNDGSIETDQAEEAAEFEIADAESEDAEVEDAEVEDAEADKETN